MSIYFLIVAIAAGFYMAFNIGANDSANSMATAVGSKAIIFKQAIIIAGILEFLGAYFVGSHVTQTIRKGIVNPAAFDSMNILGTALLAAIVGASLWVFIATWRELPVSTTHSIIGVLIGVGIVANGYSTVSWSKVGQIVMSWVISPVFSGILAFITFSIINKHLIIPEDREKRTKKYFPVFIFLGVFIIALSFLFKTPLGKKLDISLTAIFAIALVFSVLCTMVLKFIIYRKLNTYNPEEVFRILQILTSCYIAFAHGANDVANAIGPIAGIIRAV